MTAYPTDTAQVSVTVNGAPREVGHGTTIDDLVAAMTQARSGVAVAVNDSVVPRSGWPTTVLVDADRIEVLTAVQGG